MLNSENTTINTEYVSYATPNEKEVKLLQKEISSDEPVYLYMDKITSLEVQITLVNECYRNIINYYLSI